MKKYIVLGVSVLVAIIVFISGRSTYNSMVTLGENVDNQWAKVEVQYQRRMDLIPNLVETVKGYAAHESQTFENVTRARAGLTDAYNEAGELKNVDSSTDPGTFEKYNAVQDQLNRALSVYVNAVREAYPDLKANNEFENLQTQLESTENRIATERGRYTDAVKEYNIAVKRFPANIWASVFGFTTKTQYKAEEAAATAPKVQF